MRNILKCKLCKNKHRARGLCHRHYELYRKAKKRLPRHQERIRRMWEVIEAVEGKKDFKIDTSGHPNQ